MMKTIGQFPFLHHSHVSEAVSTKPGAPGRHHRRTGRLEVQNEIVTGLPSAAIDKGERLCQSARINQSEFPESGSMAS
jgi:hypothetical protein